MPVDDASVFDQEAAVARHAGENFFVGIDFADVPEAREQDAAIGGGDHFIQRRIAAGEDQIEGRFAILRWASGRPWPVGLAFIFFAVARA